MNTRFTKRAKRIIMLGASAGGVHAIKAILADLPADFPHALVIILHRLKNVESKLDKLFQSFSKLPVQEVEDKMPIEAGTVYLCPANYHLLVESDAHFALSVDEKVNFSRPSIDVSFVSLAEAFGSAGVGLLLTGANRDGARGIEVLHKVGASCLVQNPETAQVAVMPKMALELVPEAECLDLEDIAPRLNQL